MPVTRREVAKTIQCANGLCLPESLRRAQRRLVSSVLCLPRRTHCVQAAGSRHARGGSIPPSLMTRPQHEVFITGGSMEARSKERPSTQGAGQASRLGRAGLRTKRMARPHACGSTAAPGLRPNDPSHLSKVAVELLLAFSETPRHAIAATQTNLF